MITIHKPPTPEKINHFKQFGDKPIILSLGRLNTYNTT